MRHLNYGHLQYFHAIAREGSIAAAAKVLHLTPQTLSGQLRLLEEQCGAPLFDRVGRRLVLTELGELVLRYADEIFSLGAELARSVRDGAPGLAQSLRVGVSQTIPKAIAHRMIAPAFSLPEPVRVIALERPLQELLGELALHRVDVVLSDQPLPRGLSVRAVSRELGRCGVSFFGPAGPEPAEGTRAEEILGAAPLLLPAPGTPSRDRLDQWFAERDLRPRIVGEFEDSALLKIFGMHGTGLFPAPTAIEEEICEMYGVHVVVRLEDLEQRFYALTTSRRQELPAVVAITNTARNELFARSRSPPPGS